MEESGDMQEHQEGQKCLPTKKKEWGTKPTTTCEEAQKKQSIQQH